MNPKKLIQNLGFSPKENASGVFQKKYGSYAIEVDFEKELINFGKKIKGESKTTQNFSQTENWVVLECVNRLLEKGYQPQDITLEKTYPSGHGHSGRLDIFVEKEGKAFLMIECKTFGKEFEKELKNIYKNGGQLFTYFQNDRSTEVLMLYASELNAKGNLQYKNEIINIEEEYRETTNVKDFFDRWNKIPKQNGIFDDWVKSYGFQSKALTPKDLKEIQQEDSSFIFNRFLEILRHNVVSDKPNAFNKIFTLFLCKIYDEKNTKSTNELAFQWFYTPYSYEGINYPADDHISFQKRLTDLYSKGMKQFLDKDVTDISDADFIRKYGKEMNEATRKAILNEIVEVRLKKNNEFAIKEVFNDDSFDENAKVIKEVVELLQGFKIRYTKKQQYLSDFFELLLTTGLKQESGQFFTPVPIAQFIIKSLPIEKLVKEKLEKGENKNLLPKVIDYAAGSGHFITESMHEMQRVLNQINHKDYIEGTSKKIKTWKDDHFEWAFRYVYGIEKDYRLVKVGKVGCYLHGDGLAQIAHTDGLGNFKKTKEYKGVLTKTDKDFPMENKQFDIVVSNPPYSVSSFKNNAAKYYNEDDFKLYNSLTDNSSEIECLFVERTQQLLKDGGIAGIILPSSILSNTGIYTRTREIILDYFDIIAIAEFGSNTFMATGTNTVTLFLRRKNNYDHINLRDAVHKFFTNLHEVTLNGIENPVSKYVDYVWKEISLADYKTLLQKIPNETIQNHEIFIEYKKKLKAKNEDVFWEKLLAVEQEKLYYFIVTSPQKIVLIKSGTKNAEKKFLGYEFSNRRGSEGIHALQRSKNIEDCTQLFDNQIFDNPEKASTYVYKAFQGDFDFPIAEKLKKNISRQDLVDMLTFDRVDFEKNISLSVKKKVKYEIVWKTNDLKALGEVSQIKKGQSIIKSKTREGDIPVIAGGKEPAYFHNAFNRKGNVITVSASGANSGYINYFKHPIFASDCNTILSNDEKVISTRLIYLFLQSLQNEVYGLQRGQAQPHVYGEDLAKIKIPLPPKPVQKKIVSEIEALEIQVEKAREDVDKLKDKIITLFDNSKGKVVKLEEITSKIGSGATPKGGKWSYQSTGISLIRSQNIYDYGFEKKGLAFINEKQAKKLDNVTVEKNDIFFNITGASVARCCMVEDEFLPARVNQHVSIIRLNNKAIPKYVQLILISSEFKKRLLEIGEGGTSRQAITKSQLEDFKIPLPPISEQEKIVSEIEKIEAKINTLENQLAAIPQQKEAILKKYL